MKSRHSPCCHASCRRRQIELSRHGRYSSSVTQTTATGPSDQSRPGQRARQLLLDTDCAECHRGRHASKFQQRCAANYRLSSSDRQAATSSSSSSSSCERGGDCDGVASSQHNDVIDVRRTASFVSQASAKARRGQRHLLEMGCSNRFVFKGREN